MGLKTILQELNKSRHSFTQNCDRALGYLQVETMCAGAGKLGIELVLRKAKLYYEQDQTAKQMVEVQRFVKSGSHSARYPQHFDKADLWKRVLPKYEELEKELAAIDDQINNTTKAIASLAEEQA